MIQKRIIVGLSAGEDCAGSVLMWSEDSHCVCWYSQGVLLKQIYGQVTSQHWLPVSFRINTKSLTVAGGALPIMALMCLSSCHLLSLMLSTLPTLSVPKGWILVLHAHYALSSHGSFGDAFTFGQMLSPLSTQFLQFSAQMSFQQSRSNLQEITDS